MNRNGLKRKRMVSSRAKASVLRERRIADESSVAASALGLFTVSFQVVVTKPKSCTFCLSGDHATSKSCPSMKGWGRRYWEREEKEMLAREVTKIASRVNLVDDHTGPDCKMSDVLNEISHTGRKRAHHLVLHDRHKPFQINGTACIKVTLLGPSGSSMENLSYKDASVKGVTSYITRSFKQQFVFLEEVVNAFPVDVENMD
ncbi:MAG: hypothetical protein ACREBR_01345 [bacterium]